MRTAAQQRKDEQMPSEGSELERTEDRGLTPLKSVAKGPVQKENLAEALNQLESEAEPVSDGRMQPPQVPPQSQMASEFRLRTRPRPSLGSGNFQLLHSHHTESSLNKARPKQQQQFHSSKWLSFSLTLKLVQTCRMETMRMGKGLLKFVRDNVGSSVIYFYY